MEKNNTLHLLICEESENIIDVIESLREINKAIAPGMISYQIEKLPFFTFWVQFITLIKIFGNQGLDKVSVVYTIKVG